MVQSNGDFVSLKLNLTYFIVAEHFTLCRREKIEKVKLYLWTIIFTLHSLYVTWLK